MMVIEEVILKRHNLVPIIFSVVELSKFVENSLETSGVHIRGSCLMVLRASIFRTVGMTASMSSSPSSNIIFCSVYVNTVKTIRQFPCMWTSINSQDYGLTY